MVLFVFAYNLLCFFIFFKTFQYGKKIFRKTKSKIITSLFFIVIFILSSWKFISGHISYLLEVDEFVKQKIIETRKDIKDNIICNINNKYFKYKDNTKYIKEVFLLQYKLNKNQIINNYNGGYYCYYYDRENKKSYHKLESKNKINHLVINSEKQEGLLIKKSKEIYDLEDDKLIALEQTLFIKSIRYMPFFNFFDGAYWGYSNKRNFSNNIEDIVFK